MLHFGCPHCNSTFDVPESASGGISACPSCNKDVQIPRQPDGVDAPPPTPGDLPTPQQTSGLAIASLVCGLVICFPPASLAGIVMGIVALAQIGDPAKRLSGGGLAITGIITGIVGCLVVPVALLIGIMLPALGAAGTPARQMQNNSHIRGIHQGVIFHAQANGGYYPGLDVDGKLTDATVEGRFLTLLQASYFPGEYLVSPSETKTFWAGGQLDTSMYSYSMLHIADAGERQAEWLETDNSQAVVLTDRAITRPGGIGSVHTDGPIWRGTVGWNDNHVSFETDYRLSTTYGSTPTTSDNLFEPAGADDAYLIYSGED